MDYDKLIEQYRQAADKWEKRNPVTDTFDLRVQDALRDAATALSTLQAENKRLNKIVCSIPTTPDSGRTVSQYDKEMSMCAYLDDLEAENEKLRAELDAAIKQLHGHCPACTHYTPNHNEGLCRTCKHEYYNLLNNESLDNWEWRGPQKED